MRDRLKHLTTGVAVYGAGDAAITIVNFCLIAVYVKGHYLTASDYGALGLIISIEAYAKVIGRWGLDGSFMRFYLDRADGGPRQAMASTIFWFMVVVNGVLLAAALVLSPWIARAILLDARQIPALRLMLVNIFFMSFTFMPMHAMRLRREAATYSGFTFARSVGTVGLRIALVIGLKLGVAGMYLTDLAITLVLLPLMWPWMKPLLARRFSIDELRATLRFGLPRLPHGLASQTLDANPKLLLARHATAADVGVYQNGVTLGTGVAFFKNAFETAFAPFYYATAREPDAKVVFSKMATYGAAVFVLLVAGTVAVARDAILVLLDPSWLGALPVVPLVAIAFALQGVYQLTSIGLNLTNRTEFYSTATITAALVSVGAGWWLIPRYHVVGAAETVLVSYGTQVAMAFVMSQRMYPVHYEYGRVLRVVGAGVGAAAAGSWMLPASTPALAGLVLRGVLTIVVYAALLWISGFLRPTERAFLREIRARLARRPSSPRSAPARSDHDG